jgi:hypothetical protein
MGDEPLLIEGEPSRISISFDGQPLMTTDVVASPESGYGRVEDLTEQAAADYDYELDESWMEEQLFDSPETEVPTSEGLTEPHASPGTSYFLCHLFVAYFPCTYAFYYIF